MVKKKDFGDQIVESTAEEILDVSPGHFKILVGGKDSVLATEEQKLTKEKLAQLIGTQPKKVEETIGECDCCTCGHKEAEVAPVYPKTCSLKNPMVFEPCDNYGGDLVADAAMVIVQSDDPNDDDTFNFMKADVYIDEKDNKTPLVTCQDKKGKFWTGVLDRPCFIGNREYCYGMYIPMTIAPDQALFAADMLVAYAKNIEGTRPFYPRALPDCISF